MTGTLTIPATGGWQSWQTLTASVTLAAGPRQLRIVFDQAASGIVGNFGAITFAPPAASPSQAATYCPPGSQPPTSISAAKGFLITTRPPATAAARSGRPTSTSKSAGTYTVQLRVASPTAGSLHVGFNNASNVWTTVAVPSTGIGRHEAPSRCR